MPHHVGERRGRIFLPIRAQHGGGIVEAGNSAALADRVHLSVGQVPGHRCQGMSVGVAGDQRCRAGLCHVPEALLGDMREVDGDTQPVAGPHEREPRIRQAGPGVRIHRIGERHAMREDIMAAPDGAERPQSGSIEGFECGQIRVDRLAAFHMKHRRENAVRHRLPDLGRRAAQPPGFRLIEA